MDAEMKETWLAALRSGKYKQGKWNLRSEGLGEEPHFCCLGVLCEATGATYKACEAVKKVYDDCGLLVNYGGIPQYEVERLWTMNDRDGMPFEEIADWIEENL